MITCHEFRSRFAPGANDAGLLDHVRTCDACLDFAAHVDADVMFRAIGGVEIEPPGGVDAFVGDVMAQVRLRSTESNLRPIHRFAWKRHLAVAATLAVTFAGSLFVYRSNAPTIPATSVQRAVVAAQAGHAVRPVSLTTKAVVETYDSQLATILEVPTAETDNVQIVMIFDENLPADL
ncbi:MAG: hypothetical protein WA208_18855 [Thermoanaerobaculia bacterium]